MTTLLNVNLKDKSINKEKADNLRKEYIGGIGINTKILYDLVPGGSDPLGDKNVLIIGAGSLIGGKLPTACRSEITAKSPLSQGFGTANAGGKWGIKMRRAGIDHVVIKDVSEKPVLLVIDDNNIFLEKAEYLWGLDCYQATDKLKEKFGSDFSTAVIGPAGEKMVRYASIQNDYHASWGRTGMGAVMGSKNLKAVIVRGSGKVSVNDPDTLKELRREALNRIKDEPTFGPTKKYGSMITSDPFNEKGALPGYNFKIGQIEEWEKLFGRKAFEKNYKEKDVACYSCPVACAHWSKVREEGTYKGYETKGLEITFTMEFGAKLGIKKIPEVLKCVELCDRLGMDVVSAAGCVAYLIEGYEKGYFSTKDLGISPGWGDFDSIYHLLQLIGSRKGIGDTLAEGVKSASKLYPETSDFALHVKGIELPGRDPRAKMDVWSLGYLTNTRGGDHLRSRSPVESFKSGLIDDNTEELGIDEENIKNLDMPAWQKKEIFGDPPSGVDIAAMGAYAENLITIINSVGFCIRPPVLRSLGPNFYARAMKAFHGDEFTEDTIYHAANKIYNLQHKFNQREGLDISKSKFPSRFYKEELKAKNTTHPPLNHSKIQENINKYLKHRKLT